MWTQFLSCRLGCATNVIFLDVHLSCQHLGCILGNALAPLNTVLWYGIATPPAAKIRARSRSMPPNRAKVKWKHDWKSIMQICIRVLSVKRLHVKGKRKENLRRRFGSNWSKSSFMTGPGKCAWSKHLNTDSDQTPSGNKQKPIKPVWFLALGHFHFLIEPFKTILGNACLILWIHDFVFVFQY